MTRPATASNRRRLSLQELEEAVRLRELGHSYDWIGQRLGCSGNAISWHCCRLGAEAPRSTGKSWDGIVGPAVVKRGDHQVRRFTPEEDRQLLDLAGQGLTISEIGRRMNRRPNSIMGRLMTLARRDARKERAA